MKMRCKRHVGLTLLFLPLLSMALRAHAIQVPGPLVDTDWLAKHRNEVVILDVRKDTRSFYRKAKSGGHSMGGMQACGARKGGGSKVSGHIPGSALVPYQEVVVKRKVGNVKLIDEIPDRKDFEALMQKSGVNQDSAIVISHTGAGGPNVGFATRLYWTLKYFGADNVAILDGGVKKWAAEKREVEYGRTRPRKGNWKAGPGRGELLASLDEVEQVTQGTKPDTQLLDIRRPQYYQGLVYKKEKVAAKGHIPGSKNLPWIVLVNEEAPGTVFYKPEEIRQVARAMGVDPGAPTVTYCNTGHLASIGWFTLHELLGNDQARLYDGSMNEWAADPSRPVARFKQ